MPPMIISLLNNKVKQLLTNPQTDFLRGFFAAGVGGMGAVDKPGNGGTIRNSQPAIARIEP